MIALATAMNADGNVQQHWVLQTNVNHRSFSGRIEWRWLLAAITRHHRQDVLDFSDVAHSLIDGRSRFDHEHKPC
jgi:hypothetical protein